MTSTPDISKEYIESTNESVKLPRCDSYEIPKSKNENIRSIEPPSKKQKIEINNLINKEVIGKPLTLEQLLEYVIQPDIAFLLETQIKIIKLLEKIIRANLIKNIDINN